MEYRDRPDRPPEARHETIAEGPSIGSSSRWLKRRHLAERIVHAVGAVLLVVLAAMALTSLSGGIGLSGLLITATVGLLAAALMLRYPRLKVPPQEELAEGPMLLVIANTELWLESRLVQLPPRETRLVEHLGVQLDTLALEIGRLDESRPETREIRWMVGEHLPRLVCEDHALGRDGPDGDQAYDRLARAGVEIEQIARQLAEGRFDDLPILARRVDSLP